MLPVVQIKQNVPLVHCEQGESCFIGEESIEIMQFRLVYEGSLKSSGNSSRHVAEKHAIRCQFHEQLSSLYDNHEQLRSMRYYVESPVDVMNRQRAMRISFADSGASITETLARRFVRSNGFRFVPLVNQQYDLICGLNILFLRR